MTRSPPEPPKWLATAFSAAEASGGALMTVVRIVRNLPDLPFSNQLAPLRAREVIDRLSPVATSLIPRPRLSLSEESSPMEVARRVETLELPEGLDASRPWQALFDAEFPRGILLGHGDHIVAWALSPSLRAEEALESLAPWQESIEDRLSPVFDAAWGWLAHHPSDTGPGCRVVALVHLPALWRAGRLGQTKDAIDRMGGRLIPVWGGRTQDSSLFAISHREALGRRPDELVFQVRSLAGRLVEEEAATLDQLRILREQEMHDAVMRSAAILGSARLLTATELSARAALIALGGRTGWLPPDAVQKSIELLLRTRSAHLATMGPPPGEEVRADLDDLRAEAVRAVWNGG